MTVYFDIFFDQLILYNGTHTTAGVLVFPISGTGPIDMILNDVRISGSISMNTINGGYLNLDTPNINVAIGSSQATLRGFGFLLDTTISVIISGALPTLIAESQERITEVIVERFIEPANMLLNQFRLIDILLAIIAGNFPFGSK